MSTIEGLPELIINVSGNVISSNANQFRDYALGVLKAIPRKFETDQDFADAELRVKWCKSVEEKLQLAKSGVQNQMVDIDAIFSMIDEVSTETRRVRLEFEKLVSTRKQEIKDSIISSAKREWDSYLYAINAQITPCEIPLSMPDFAGAIKGKRTIESIQNAIDLTLLKQQRAADSELARIKVNLDVVRNAGNDLLFADIETLCIKGEELVAMTVNQRLADHKAAKERATQAQKSQEYEAAQEVGTYQAFDAIGKCENCDLSIDDIGVRLGFDVDSNLIKILIESNYVSDDFEEKQFTEMQFIKICDLLIKHISFVLSKYKK